MSKKHYEALAAVIEETKEDCAGAPFAQSALKMTAERIADYLATDNPRFDRARFLRACGIEG
jgi:hypothetical protein